MLQGHFLPISSEFVISQLVVGHVEALQRSQIAQDVFADIVDDVVGDVEPLEVTGPGENTVGEDWHAVEAQINLLQFIRDPVGGNLRKGQSCKSHGHSLS